MSDKTMPLANLLRDVVDGDEHGWETEFAYLREHHAEQLAALARSVAADGIREPIIIGPDGRIWDGHHRLCVAHMLDLTSVPIKRVLKR